MKAVKAIFICDLCDYKAEEKVIIGEGIWPPDSIHLVGDEVNGELFCPKHYEEWKAQYWKENPDAVWMA